LNNITEDLVDNVFDALETAKKAHSLLPPLPPDLKPVYMRILHAIYRIRDTTGNARVTDINTALNFSLPNTTKFVNELFQLKIVEKSTLSTDKRVVLVHATEIGEEYIHKYILTYQTRLLDEFMRIGKSDCTTMIETITKVYQAMGKIYSAED